MSPRIWRRPKCAPEHLIRGLALLPARAFGDTTACAASIPADEAPAKEAGKTDEEIAIYKFCTGLADGSAKEQCAEGCEMGPPGAPPLPMDAMLGICAKMTVAFPDWKSLCLGITKNDDGWYNPQQQLAAP